MDLVNDKLYAACMLVVVLSSINDMSAEDRFLLYILNGCRLLVFRILYFEWLSVAHYSVCASDFIFCRI